MKVAHFCVFLIRLDVKSPQCFRTMRQWLFILWMFGVVGSGISQTDSLSERRDDLAQLPYHELVKISQSDSSQPKKQDTLTFVLASNKSVPLDQITLTLLLKKGSMSLKIDSKGHFTVPFSDQLMDENPLMISNQQRGSLSLKFTLAVPELGKIESPKVVDGKVKYQAVFQSMLRFKEAMKKVDTKFGEDGNQQLAVECMTKGKEITIHQKFGTRSIKAGEDGMVWLMYNDRLFQENPDISVPSGTEFNLRPVSPGKVKEINKK